MAKRKKRNGHARTTRSDYVRSLVREHGIKADDIADMATVSVHTVTAWLRPNTAKAHREPKQAVVELLALKTRKPLPRSLVA